MSKTIASGIFIVNKDNEVLICHPTNHLETLWSIPKGKVESDENKIEAAIRETKEETNIDLKKVDSMIRLGPQKYVHNRKILYPYLVLETLNPRIDFSSFDIKCISKVSDDRGDFPEMDDFKWVSFDEAKKLLHYTQVPCIDEIQKTINKLTTK